MADRQYREYEVNEGGKTMRGGGMTKDEAVKMTAKNASDLPKEQAEKRRIR